MSHLNPWLAGTMKAIVSALVVIVMLSGYAHHAESPELDYSVRKATFRSHSFEPKLYVVGRKIPLLSAAEWTQIKPQFEKQTEFVFESAYRDSLDLVRVNLDRRGDSLRGDHLTLFFEKMGGNWVENDAKREETVILTE